MLAVGHNIAMEPRIEYHYTVRYRDKIRNKWVNSRYKMSESTAAERYADTEWEIIPHTRVERRVGGDPLANSMARFQSLK
jgi:hypothetical protein